MNCETIANNLPDIVSGTLSPTQIADYRQHIDDCPDCREALRGAEGLALLKNREIGEAPPGFFEKISTALVTAPETDRPRQGFWLGTGFGGAVAASLLALALTFGWISPPAEQTADAAEFIVALSEPHNMDVAIETDRTLKDAEISVLLSGGVRLDGYGDRRELSWTTDLDAGINRLSLPILAFDPVGGQVIVRLNHPDSEQLFVVQLKTEA